MSHLTYIHSTLISVMTQFQSHIFHWSHEGGRLLNLPPTASDGCAKICPHLAIHSTILSIQTCPSAPSYHLLFLPLYIPRVGLGGNNSLSSEQQLWARHWALMSEEQLFFAIPGSITVRNDNVGVERHHELLLILYKIYISFLPTQHISHSSVRQP